jgi:hypothetical protein
MREHMCPVPWVPRTPAIAESNILSVGPNAIRLRFYATGPGWMIACLLALGLAFPFREVNSRRQATGRTPGLSLWYPFNKKAQVEPNQRGLGPTVALPRSEFQTAPERLRKWYPSRLDHKKTHKQFETSSSHPSPPPPPLSKRCAYNFEKILAHAIAALKRNATSIQRRDARARVYAVVTVVTVHTVLLQFCNVRLHSGRDG